MALTGGLRRAVAGCSATLRVLALVALLTAATAWAWPTASALGPPATSLDLPWWLLAVLFAVTEMCVLHVQVKREAQTVSLSEVPLVLGLFFADPLALLVGRLVGSVTVAVLHRRQAPIKVVFNAALWGAEICLALLVFGAVLRGTGVSWAWEVLATYVALAVTGAVVAVVTTVVIALYGGAPLVRELVTATVSGAPAAVAVGTVALVTVTSLRDTPGNALLLLGTAVLVLLSYRAYALLSERHLSLERLYRFSRVVSSSPEVDEVLARVLTQARDLLRAERAELTFFTARDDLPGVRVRLEPHSEALVRGDFASLEADGVWRGVVARGEAVLAPRGGKDLALREWLAANRLGDAVIVPLRGDVGVVGTLLVGDRLGDIKTFSADDVRLLETVANHASLALQNGHLIDRLRHDALHDALTGLPNRTLLRRRLEQAVTQPGDGGLAAVMIMDLDGFKEVNDTLGHQHGDELLKEVGRRMVDCLGESATVARLGGDEFAVLLPSIPDAETAGRAAERLLAALEQPVDIDEVAVQVGGSMGVAVAPLHGTEASVLLKRADVAMYAAKGSSGGYRLYDVALDTTSPQKLALVAELRQALQLEQLHIVVQPKVDLLTGDVLSVEALVRWDHPQQGPLSPAEFVPLAERSGLVRPLTFLVLRRALETVSAWRRQGLQVGVAVNLSSRGLADIGLEEEVARLLALYDVPPHLLTLEITESSVMTDSDRTIPLLQRLSDSGCRLSLDDFGTGYSSLSYLKRLPVHEVKIDRSFVMDLDRGGEDEAIVRSILDLGANLGLEVVAEGIETAETWKRLADMGCDLGQGYHIAKPMPPEELPVWVAARLDRELASLAGTSAP